jgi:competence protein ComEA
VLDYTRRQIVLLFGAAAVAACGLGIDRWRRANTDTVAYLESLDRAAAPSPPPGPTVEPGTRRAVTRSATLRSATAASADADTPHREPSRLRRRHRDDATPLDVNAASAADFERLPGVGPALAARIVDLRTRDGPFSSVDDLRRVRGVGETTLARLRARLAVNTP